MPVLERQAVGPVPGGAASPYGATPVPPSLAGLPPRSVPETKPTPLEKHYVLLSVPGHVYELFPIAALIGTLFALARLVANSVAALHCPSRREGKQSDGVRSRAPAGYRRRPRALPAPNVAALVGLAALPRRAPRCSWRERGTRRRDRRSTEDRTPADRYRLRRRRPVVARHDAELRTRCGSAAVWRVEGEDRHRLACASCGYVAYVNPPRRDDVDQHRRQVVLLRRESAGRAWAQPASSVDETVTEAAIRETLEETGLVVEPGEIVGLYSRLEAAVVVIAFEARVLRGEYRLNPEALEIQAFRPEAIPWHGIAFKTTHWALRDWVRRRRPDIHPDERHWDG